MEYANTNLNIYQEIIVCNTMPERGAGNYSTTLGEILRWAGTPFRGALFNSSYPGLRCACPGPGSELEMCMFLKMCD